MKRLIWNIRYSFIARDFLKCSWKQAWKFAVNQEDTIAKENSPRDAFEDELTYWCFDASLYKMYNQENL